jgi:hypothetical protein
VAAGARADPARAATGDRGGGARRARPEPAPLEAPGSASVLAELAARDRESARGLRDLRGVWCAMARRARAAPGSDRARSRPHASRGARARGARAHAARSARAHRIGAPRARHAASRRGGARPRARGARRHAGRGERPCRASGPRSRLAPRAENGGRWRPGV